MPYDTTLLLLLLLPLLLLLFAAVLAARPLPPPPLHAHMHNACANLAVLIAADVLDAKLNELQGYYTPGNLQQVQACLPNSGGCLWCGVGCRV